MDTKIIEFIQEKLGTDYEIYDDVKIQRKDQKKIAGMYRSNKGRLEKGTTGEAINQVVSFSIQFMLPETDAPSRRESIAAMMALTSNNTFLSSDGDLQYYLVWTGATEEGNIVLEGTKRKLTYSIHGEAAVTNAYLAVNDLIFKISNDDGSTYKVLGGIYSVAFDDELTIHTADDYQNMEMKGKGTKQSRSFQLTLMCMKTDAHKILFDMSNDPDKRKRKLTLDVKWAKLTEEEGNTPATYLFNASGTYLMSGFKLALQNNTYASLIVNFEKTR
jgi:hypothetical protein